MDRAAFSRRGNHRARGALTLVCVLVLGLLLTACGGKGRELAPTVNTLPSASASPKASPVTITGLPDAAKLQVSDGDPGTAPGGSLDFVSSVYSIGPSGPLPTAAKVSIELDHALPRSTALVVGTREGLTDSWTWLPATLSADQKHAEFTTRHLSQFGVLAIDAPEVISSFKQQAQAGLVSGVNKAVKRPTCTDPKKARLDGYTATVLSPPRGTLAWCFGLEKDKRVLKVVNRRLVPVQVSHGDAVATATTSNVRGVWTTWLGILAPGSKDTFLAPGGSVTYDAELEPKTKLDVTAETDARAQSVRALYSAVRAIVAEVQNFGVATPDPVQTFQGLVARPQCADALGQGSDALLAGCLSLRKMKQTFGNNALLLAPLVSSRSMKVFLANRFKFLSTQDQKVDTQQVTIARAAPDFAGLVGTFRGHTRSLRVTKDGLVTETQFSGCCQKVISLTYQLSEPRTTGKGAKAVTTATALLTKVSYDKKTYGSKPPKPGATGTIIIKNGVVTTPFASTTYCDRAAGKKGKCGA
jgi:hypothetical protein